MLWVCASSWSFSCVSACSLHCQVIVPLAQKKRGPRIYSEEWYIIPTVINHSEKEAEQTYLSVVIVPSKDYQCMSWLNIYDSNLWYLFINDVHMKSTAFWNVMPCSVAVYVVLEEHTCTDKIVRSCTSSVALILGLKLSMGTRKNTLVLLCIYIYKQFLFQLWSATVLWSKKIAVIQKCNQNIEDDHSILEADIVISIFYCGNMLIILCVTKFSKMPNMKSVLYKTWSLIFLINVKSNILTAMTMKITVI